MGESSRKGDREGRPYNDTAQNRLFLVAFVGATLAVALRGGEEEMLSSFFRPQRTPLERGTRLRKSHHARSQ